MPYKRKKLTPHLIIVNQAKQKILKVKILFNPLTLCMLSCRSERKCIANLAGLQQVHQTIKTALKTDVVPAKASAFISVVRILLATLQRRSIR